MSKKVLIIGGVTSIIKAFSLTVASTGNNERTLKHFNIPYKTITVHPVSHASYYPGGFMMTLKLIFNEDGKSLGAQGVGSDGVDMRIDVIATVIRQGGTVSEIGGLNKTEFRLGASTIGGFFILPTTIWIPISICYV